MLKQFLNTGSLKSLMLFEKDADGNEIIIDPKVALREQIAKGNLPAGEVIVEKEENKEEDKDDDEEDEGEEKEEDKEEELTPEQIKEKEANEKVAAKAQRKQDRMQRRIDDAIGKQKAAEAETARLKAQIEANPDLKLTAEEVQTRAEAIANKKIQEKEIADIQAQFDKDCDSLQKDARKIDKEFDDKIGDIAEQFGPIPSFMIGVLSDFENGGEVLAKIASDEDLAEEIYDLKSKPAKMTRKLVELSNELIAAKKKPKKEISRVEAGVEPVKAARTVSTTITESDTKNMDNYVAKRQAQMADRHKVRGF